MKEDFIPVKIWAVITAEGGPIILLINEEKRRYLIIRVEQIEAQTIGTLLIDLKSDRPMMIDQLAKSLEKIAKLQNFQYTGVVITELKDGAYYAVLENSLGEQIDYHPSDAMAVALKMGLPIFVADDLLLQEWSSDSEEGAPAGYPLH